jgi:hypothetical protein
MPDLANIDEEQDAVVEEAMKPKNSGWMPHRKLLLHLLLHRLLLLDKTLNPVLRPPRVPSSPRNPSRH